jgi:hypothetical protein
MTSTRIEHLRSKYRTMTRKYSKLKSVFIEKGLEYA